MLSLFTMRDSSTWSCEKINFKISEADLASPMQDFSLNGIIFARFSITLPERFLVVIFAKVVLCFERLFFSFVTFT